MYLSRANADSIAWLVEGIDDEGEETVIHEKTTPEAIERAYKTRKLPPDVHVLDMLRERVERR